MEETGSLKDLEQQELILLQSIKALESQLTLIRMKMEYLKSSSQQKVNSSPCSSKSENEPSPVTMSTGKGGLNPLAVCLQKTEKQVQTCKNVGESSKEINLRPNGGIQNPIVKEQSLQKTYKNFYVIFNGPYPGIYTNWEYAEKAVKGHSGVKHRKFKNFSEAKAAAEIYTTSMMKPQLQFITDDSHINPYMTALSKISSLKVIGNKPAGPAKQQVEFILDEDSDFSVRVTNSWEDFYYLYSCARRATDEQFRDQKFYTVDKNNVSYITTFPGVVADLPYEAFQFGLLNTVYPSESLEEISLFPKEFKAAVQQFKKKVLKKEQSLFIKFQSTVCFWEGEDDMENYFSPYSHVSIGAVKEMIYQQSQEKKPTLEKKDLKVLAESQMLSLIEKIFSLPEEPKLHVNFASYCTIITSFSHKGMTETDKKKLHSFKERIIAPLAMGRHEESFCRKKEKLLARLGVQYSCKFCTTKAKAVEENKSESSGPAADTKSQPTPSNGAVPGT